MKQMQKRTSYLFAAACALLLGGQTVRAQSDSETLRSPVAGLVSITEFDFGLSVRDGQTYPLSVGAQTVFGFQFNKLFTLGAGLGIQGYGPSAMTLLPLFVDARMHFPQKHWTPFLALDMGYALSLRSTEKGGVLVNPSFGGRFPLSKSLAMSLSVGYRSQGNQAKVNGVFDHFNADYMSVKAGMVVRLKGLTKKMYRRMKDKK